MDLELERGDIVVCALSGDFGKSRLAVVVQSNLFNSTHPSVTLCPITTHIVEAPLFRLMLIPSAKNGLKQSSQIMVDKITTLLREKIRQKIGDLNPKQISELNEALTLWLT